MSGKLTLDGKAWPKYGQINFSPAKPAEGRPNLPAMARINDRPVILALSNPTDHAECTPEQAYRWSNGKAIYAAGVQFPPVHLNGQTFLPGQANNFYVFPAIGMAVFGPRRRVLVIPSATIARVAGRLETHGRIPRGYLGWGNVSTLGFRCRRRLDRRGLRWNSNWLS